MSVETEIDGIGEVQAVVWSFDSVLNLAGRATDDRGLASWQLRLEAELGLDASSFSQTVLDTQRRAVMTGQDEILDRIEAWIDTTGFEGDCEDILEVWFDAAADPDPELARLMLALDDAGVTQAISLTADPRMARHLVLEAGLGEMADAVFVTGEIGAMPRDVAFLYAIEQTFDLPPEALLLIDQDERVAESADARGWKTWEFRHGEAMGLATALMPLLLRKETAQD